MRGQGFEIECCVYIRMIDCIDGLLHLTSHAVGVTNK